MRTYGLIKVIGLSLTAAVGLTAFTATAQAAEELTLKSKHLAILLNSGSVLPTGTATTVTGKQVGTVVLKIPAKNSEIRCEKGAVTEASVENETDTKKNPEGEELTEASESKLAAMGKGKVEFSKCKVFTESTGTELTACTTEFNKNNPEPSAKVLFLAFLHFHKSTIKSEELEHDISVARLTPLSGTLFTKLKFGGICSLPENIEVTGSASTEIPQTDAAVQKITFDTASAAGKAVTKDAKTKISFGTSEAFIKGEIELELTKSPKWGVMSNGEVFLEELTLKSKHLAILLNSGSVLPTGTATTVTGKQVGTVVLKIPAKNSEIRCEKGAVTEASVENETDTKKNPEGEELTEASESKLAAMGKGKVEFSKCKVFTESTGTELTACTTEFNKNNPEFKEVEGTREATPSAKVLFLAFLHFHKSTIKSEELEHDISVARLTPLSGTLFTKLKFGGTCSLPENIEVTGSASTEIPQTDAAVQKITFDTASAAGKAVTKDAKTKISFGTSEAFIKGEVELELTGSPSWGAMPGGKISAEELTLVSKHLAILLSSGDILKVGTKTVATGIQVGAAILKIPAKNAEINCEKGTVTEASIENEADTKKNPEGEELTAESESKLSAMGQGKIQFSKCKVLEESTGKELSICTTEFNKNSPEFIEVEGKREAAPSAKVLFLAFLHFHKSTIKGEELEHDIFVARLTPLSGTLFTKLKFGGACALPENIEVTGSIAAEAATTDAVKQTVNFDGATAAGKAVTKDAKAKLSFGVNEAFIKSTIQVELEGAPSWGVMSLNLISKHLAILLGSGTLLKTGTKTTVSGTQLGSFSLHIPGKNTELRCEKGTLTESSAENEADTKKNPEGEELTAESESKLSAMGQGKIQFSKCKVLEESTGKELSICTTEFNKNNPEFIEVEGKREAAPSAKVLILTFLHFHKSTIAGEALEHHIYIARITPLSGTVFTKLKFGGTCSLSESQELKGSVATEIPKTDAVKQTLSVDGATAAGKAVAKDAKTKISFGANETFIKSEIEIELNTGGVPWGVM